MATLVPCAGCARHVRATESACPFCDAEIVATPRALEAMPSDRLLARTAITFAAAAATTLVACGKEQVEKPPAPISTIDNNGPAPAYGPPPVMMDDASANTPPPAPAPTESTDNHRHAPVPLYGVPPMRGK